MPFGLMTVLSRSRRAIGIDVAFAGEDPPSGVRARPRTGDCGLGRTDRQGVLPISGMVALGAPTLSTALYVAGAGRLK